MSILLPVSLLCIAAAAPVPVILDTDLGSDIDDKGNTVPDPENGRPVRCALKWKDRGAFEKELIRRLTDGASMP